MATPISFKDTVRALTLASWGAQTCRRPSDLPQALGRLARMKDALEEAVSTLAVTFAADTPPTDPALAIWAAFPVLDDPHCRQLARRLIEARNAVRAEFVA